VIISDSIEPLRTFLTGRAVLHGDAAHPCVRSFDAEPVGSEGTGEQALVSVDDPSHSWLFRGTGAETPGLEYRLMSCRLDPKTEVPPEVYTAPDTMIGN
jgi:hypothetical protein